MATSAAVPPGGMFSFNAEVGPTTLEAGFEWGFGLTTGANGGAHTVPSVAGGICQVATTLFQAAFWGGYQLEERYWHLYWIPAYTSRGLVGLDATVDADSGLDLKWINPTDQAVLIQASADAEHITFKLYGQQPPWTVRVDDPIVSDRVVADPTPDVQEEGALPHSPQRRRAEFIRSGRALSDTIRQARAHVMHCHVGKEIGGFVTQCRGGR